MREQEPDQEIQENGESDSQAIDNLLRDIETFNNQHHMGTAMAELILNRLEPKRQGAPKISLENLTSQHGSVMEKIGISVEKLQDPKQGVAFGSGNEGESVEVRPYRIGINLADGEKFIEYLRSIDGIEIGEQKVENLKKIADNLTTQLKTEYNLEDAGDDRLLELFGNLQNVIQEYERLDIPGTHLAEAVSELKKFLEVARQKYLKEYLAVTEGGLLVEIGGKNFGPSTWQIDCSPEAYTKHWERAFTTLNQIRQNPDAADFYRQTVTHLQESLDYALADMTESKDRYKPEYIKPLIPLAEKFRERIKDY